MKTENSASEEHQKKLPLGVLVVAGACFCAAAALVILGVLAGKGVVSLTSGTFLLQGLELMGPVIFYLMAALTVFTGLGLLRRWKIGRWLAVALIGGIGVGRMMPISSAVIDFRVLAIIRDGAMIIACVAAVRYLLLEEIRDQF